MMDNKEHIAVLQFIASQYAAPNFTMEREAMSVAITALQQQSNEVDTSGEVVAWLCVSKDGNVDATCRTDTRDDYERFGRMITPLYTHPPKVQGEALAVYQFECDDNWVDCTKEHFEGHDGSEKRILFTQPSKPVVSDAMVDLAFNAWCDIADVSEWRVHNTRDAIKSALAAALSWSQNSDTVGVKS